MENCIESEKTVNRLCTRPCASLLPAALVALQVFVLEIIEVLVSEEGVPVDVDLCWIKGALHEGHE